MPVTAPSAFLWRRAGFCGARRQSLPDAAARRRPCSADGSPRPRHRSARAAPARFDNLAPVHPSPRLPKREASTRRFARGLPRLITASSLFHPPRSESGPAAIKGTIEREDAGKNNSAPPPPCRQQRRARRISPMIA